MQWCLDQATKRIEITYQEAEQKVQQELDNEIKSIWETFDHVANDGNSKKDETHLTSSNIGGNENIRPCVVNSISDSQNNDATKKMSELMISNTSVDENVAVAPSQLQTAAAIRIDVVSGPYTGKFFMLKPTPRTACLIGRSTSKKFKEKGISLPQDGEVSTSHGKIEMISNKYYYIDTGSTNGSRLKESGYDIPAHEPILLPKESITELIIGATTLQIQIL